MIWHDRKIVFIHIPKCGGTSVRKAIQKKVGGTHRNRTWLHGWKVLDGGYGINTLPMTSILLQFLEAICI